MSRIRFSTARDGREKAQCLAIEKRCRVVPLALRVGDEDEHRWLERARLVEEIATDRVTTTGDERANRVLNATAIFDLENLALRGEKSADLR
jgi:hypothetical protein